MHLIGPKYRTRAIGKGFDAEKSSEFAERFFAARASDRTCGDVCDRGDGDPNLAAHTEERPP